MLVPLELILSVLLVDGLDLLLLVVGLLLTGLDPIPLDLIIPKTIQQYT